MADIPAEKIVAIQLNDVQARAYAAAILRDESMHDRALPGKGYGAKVNIQLQHAGPEGNSMLATGDALNAALAI